MKNVIWELVPGSFTFQRVLSKKESKEIDILSKFWANSDSFAVTYLI